MRSSKKTNKTKANKRVVHKKSASKSTAPFRAEGPKKPNKNFVDDKEKMPRGRHVTGIHSVREALKVRPKAIDSVWLRKDWDQNNDLVEIHAFAIKNNIDVNVRPVAFFDRITQTHQGVCVVVTERPAFNFNDLKKNEKQIVLILDGLEDPHNLGAILRTSWLLNVKAIYVPKKKGSPLTATALKVATGAAEHIPVVEEANLGSVIKDLQDIGFWAYGLAQNHDVNLYNVELPEKVVWVIGSEGKGIRLPILRACDQTVSIPQSQPDASYNASVACAMALSETTRQHQK